ncbi:MAG: NAD(P)H-hydrate dehydratase [Clostridia bacterium]|nr:NAD(P)H-hydrate dehydratase [Clostridia bacterium]
MRKTISPAAMRRLEQAAVDSGAVSYLQLMEAAGKAAAQVILDSGLRLRKAVCLCGSGNNGGDGFVIARHLYERGVQATVVLLDEPKTADARAMKDSLPPEIPVRRWDAEQSVILQEAAHANVIVDAVYGIGFHGELPKAIRPLFAAIEQSGVPVVAVDVPSGMDAATGAVSPGALHAAQTVTFTAAKPGFSRKDAAAYIGTLHIRPVGIDERLIATYYDGPVEITHEMVTRCFPPRPADSHKGTFGRLLCVCGSYGMAGAAMLAADAALRCGIGLLTAALPRSIYPIVAGRIPEAVYAPLPETEAGTLTAAASEPLAARLQTADAVLIGCGLSQHPETAALLMTLLSRQSVPMVIDADGLNILAAHRMEWKPGSAPLVLTPHPAEMARLTGQTVADIQNDRVGAATRFAEEHGVTLVLKGHETIVATPDGEIFWNPTGCAGMATGGSGDVLAGMIASFLAQGFSAADAACCGVYLHGLAGERASARMSQIAMLPRDMLTELPILFSEIENGE